MRLTEELVRCKTQGEMLKIVEPEARALLRDWKQKLLEEALEHLVERNYGPRWQRKRPQQATPWICLGCGPRDSSQVKRNGHYQRYLVVLEGTITLKVPQLRCRQCGKAVALGALFLPSRKRYWIDMDKEITELYLSGVSYRQVKAIVERRIESGAGLMSLWRRFQERAKTASYPGLKDKLKVLYLDEAYTKINGEPYWSLLALGEGYSGNRAYLGAVQSPDRSEAAWSELLDSLEIPEQGRGLLVLHDGDQAIIAALGMALPKAKSQCCLWHQLHNVYMQAKELHPDDYKKVKEIVKAARGRLSLLGPRTTSPLERGIKEYRRRTRPMDGFGSRAGASNFLRAWMVKENARMAEEDWLSSVVN